MKRRTACLGVLLMALSGAASAQTLTVSAAASLTDAFQQLRHRFEALHPGVTLRFNFAASGVLLQQIAQGAPADVLATADADTLDRAAAQRLITPDTRRTFATNALVLVTPPDSTLQNLNELTRPEVKRIALGKVASVPAGRYTQQVLGTAQLWSAVTPKLVFADHVRQVLDYVARGEVDAGFVYRTDARAAGPRVRTAGVVTGHSPITYPVAVVADTRHAPQARAFVDFLASTEARGVLAQFGFSPP